jgi:hypothetical protein
MNTTDLHIQYHMETGKDHQWRYRSTGQFHSTENYSREYASWMEEKYLELINTSNDQSSEIEKLKEEFWIEEKYSELINTSNDQFSEIEKLKAELEAAHEKINSLEEEYRYITGRD